MNWSWINGGLLLAWIVCPIAAIIIVTETNRWLRRRAIRRNRPRTIRVHLAADTTQFITEMQRAAELSRDIEDDTDKGRR